MTLPSFARADVRRSCSVRSLNLVLLVGLVACLVIGNPTWATTFTWTGTGTNGNWGDVFQWSGLSAPPTGGVNTDIVLQGSDTSPDIQDIFNNNVNYDIDSITLSSSYTGAGAMFLGGGELTVDNEIVNNDPQEFEFNSVVQMGDQLIGIRANNGTIDFDAAVDVNFINSTINATGEGDIFFDGGITSDFLGIDDTNLNIFDGTFVRIGGSSSPIGDVNINDGTLQINSTSNLPTTVDINVAAGSLFDLNNFSESIDQLTGSGSVTLGTATLTLGDTSSFSFFGTISGTGGITKDQSGTMTIAGSNTYTGVTSITNGTLLLSGSGQLSNSTDVSVSSGGTFDLNGVSDTVDSIAGAGTIRLGGAILTVDETAGTRTFSGNILETGEMQKNGNGTLVLSGSNTFTLLDINAGTVQVSSQGNLGSGTVEVGSGTLQATASFTNARPILVNSAAAIINVDTSDTLTQSGVISGSSNFTKLGNGTLGLSASNTHTGDININDGILALNNSNRVNDTSDITLLSGATFDLNGFTETVDTLSGTGGNVATDGGLLTVDENSAVVYTFSGVITGTGGRFTKTGTHIMVLGGANSYTGATTVSGGTLRLGNSNRINDASDLVVNASGTFDLNGFSETVDSLTGSGSVLLNGSLLVNEGGGSTRTYSGVMSGGGTFVKAGTHIQVFTGNNTYTGTTTLDAGVLRVGSSSNLGSGGLIFDSGTLNTTASFTNSRAVLINSTDSAIFDVNTSTTLTQSGTISGDATTTLIKQGGGTLTTTSSNVGTFSGDILVSNGTFNMAGGGDALGNSTTVTVNSPGTFLVNSPDDIGGLAGNGSVILNQILRVGHDNASTSFSGVISGTSIFGKRGTGTVTLTGNNTYTGLTDIDAGILRLSGSGRLGDSTDVDIVAGATFDLNDVTDAIDALTGAGSVLLGAGGANSLTVGSNNGSGTFSGNITEAGGFIKVGSGTQTLSGNNTWTAGTQINGGVLRISDTTTNLGTGGITLDGGTLESTATLNNFKGILLNAGGGTIDVNAGTTFTMAAATPFTGVGALTKTDTGTLVLTANNTYTGDTNINSGLLQYSGGQLSDLTDVNVAGGATWDLNGVSDTVKSIAGAGNILLGGATLTVNQNGGGTIFSGVISEAGGLTKDGTHTLTLSGANTYTGPTTINVGTLGFSANANLGDSNGDLSFDGGTLYLNPSTVDLGVGRSIVLNAGSGTVFVEAGGTLTIPGIVSGAGELTVQSDNEETVVLSGVNTYLGGTKVIEATLSVSQNANLGDNGGAVTLASGIFEPTTSFTNQHGIVLEGTGSFAVPAATTLTQAAGISGTGNLHVSGFGTVLLTAPATHTGNTNIGNNATLLFGSGELPDAFDVTVNGTWDLNGVSDTIDGLFGAGTVLLGGGTLTVGEADGDGDFSGSIQEAGSFVKIGPGKQILSGVNSYLGSTEINEGVLEITNDASLGNLASTLSISDGVLRTNTTFTTGRTTTVASGAFETAATTTLTFTSPIGGAGPMLKQGTGTLELTQSNTYVGLTDVRAGTLRLTGAGQLADASDVDVDAGATFDITDITDTIDALTGSGNVLLGLGTLTIGANNGGGTFSGVIGGVGGAVVKQGAGTEVFSGISTYTGGTFVDGGVLEIGQSENLGALGTLLSFDGGTLNSTASFGMIRGISLNVGGGTFDVDTATTLDASGNITGLGSLTKIGEGTLVLSGFSTYQGGTIINGGTVETSSSFNLGNSLGTLTLDNGTLHTTGNITTSRPTIIGPGAATFDTDGSTTFTLTGLISGNAGAAGLTKAGAGTLKLESANSFSAATRLTGGVLQVDAGNQLGNAGNTIDLLGGSLNTLASFANARTIRIGVGGGGINVATGTTLTQSGVIQDDTIGPVDGLAKDGTGTLLATASNTYTGATAINAGTLQLDGAGRLPDLTDVTVAGGAFFDLNNVSDTIDALAGSGDITLGSGSLTLGADDGDGTYGGTISGAGGLAKNGIGTQTLRIKPDGMGGFLPNSYTGGTAINGGVLDVEKDDSLGDPAGSLSFDGGTLQVQGATNSVTSTRAVTLNAGGGTVNTVDMNASVTFGGVIGGTGSLTKDGLGPLTLAASNAYTGDTIIDQGLLRLQGSGRLPDASTVVVNATTGVTPQEGLDLNSIDDAIDGLEGSGDIDLGSGTLTVGSAGSGGDFDGVIEGTGGFEKTGAGSQILAGVNTYTGGTAVNGGILEISANIHLGNPAGSLSFDGGTLRTDGTFSMARATTIAAGGGTFDVPAANTLTHTAVISDIGGLGKSNGGTLVVSGINTYTGPTNITGGTLQLGGIERLANQTDVSVSGGAVFDLNNFNESIDSLSGSGSVQLGSAQLIVGLDNGSGSFGGVLSGTGNLLKEGTGTQTLTGAHTYSGATFVDRGELVLSGSGSVSQATLVTGFNIGSDGTTTVDGAATTWDLSGNLFVGFDGTGQMNIDNGATVTVEGDVTIGGNGIAGTLSLDGGTLDNAAGNGITVTTGALQGHGSVIGNVFSQGTVAPGNSDGILALTGNYIQDTTGLFSIEIGGDDNSDPQNPQFDFFDISGTASLAGQLELALISGFTPAQVDTFTVLTASSLAGVFSNVANGARLNIAAGGTGSFQVDYTSNALILSDFQGVGSSIPGDFDDNGVVNGGDFLLWQRNLSIGLLADWEANYGMVAPLSASSAAVPEPTTSALALAALCLAMSRRWT